MSFGESTHAATVLAVLTDEPQDTSTLAALSGLSHAQVRMAASHLRRTRQVRVEYRRHPNGGSGIPCFSRGTPTSKCSCGRRYNPRRANDLLCGRCLAARKASRAEDACPVCFGLSHRRGEDSCGNVVADHCHGCGLHRRELAPLDLADYLYQPREAAARPSIKGHGGAA